MLSRLKVFAAALALIAVSASIVSSHPHFRKSLVAKMPDLEVKLEYTTYPWNAAHLAEVKEGYVFNCGNATVELSKAVKPGAAEIAAGKYLLRARAKTVDNWTLLLIPAPPDRNTQPDMSRAVELQTRTLGNRPVFDHLLLDVSAGHGDTDNKGLIVLAWGDRQLEGVLADFSGK
jgi:hypothetical protein